MPIQPKRLRLKGWLDGESLRNQIRESKSTEELITHLYSYLTLIYGEKKWKRYSWMEIAEFMYMATSTNSPTIDFPMFKYSSDGGKPIWDYPQRLWYLYANMLAAKYGWSLEYIAELEIDDAFGLIQEIFVDEHLEKEWQWNLSELTYSYDAKAKTSKHTDYPRPKWMLPEKKPMSMGKVPKSMMPVGLIITNEQDQIKH